MDVLIPLAQIVEEYGDNKDALLAALYEREDLLVTGLHLWGARLGLMYPDLVAYVVSGALGMGSPISAEQTQLLLDQFHARIARLQSGDTSI